MEEKKFSCIDCGVAKDRVLGHNPIAAIYQADFYYKKLKEDSDKLK